MSTWIANSTRRRACGRFTIRTARPSLNDNQGLRNEVMDLKKENREIREEMKALSQKLQALTKEPAATNKAKNAKPAPRKR